MNELAKGIVADRASTEQPAGTGEITRSDRAHTDKRRDDIAIASLATWLTCPMPEDVSQSIERLRRADDVRHVAVMPDVHLSNEVCVGVAMATSCLIYPAAVGSDIGCGMAAIGLDSDASLLANEMSASRLLAGLYRAVPAMKHPRAKLPGELPATLGFGPARLSDARLEKLKHRDGRFQLGTLGRGNHFVEFQADEQDRLWLMVHTGSRGMGQAVSSHHAHIARSKSRCGKLMHLDSESAAGQAYLNDVAWSVRYAESNRLAIVAAVERLLLDLFNVPADASTLIHGDHNHVRQEYHFGEPCWVHRKGALPAGDGMSGVIPGSMGTASYHVIGRGECDSLCSSSHGAGRVLRRGDAAKQIGVRQLEREMRHIWFDHRNAMLLRDEAPSAYKEIRAVMRAQRELTRIVRQLRPLLSYKGL